MKICEDFITNSSSSSYICNVCGSSEYAWETPDYMEHCEWGHLICADHLIDILENPDEHRNDDWEIYSKHCPICMLEVLRDSDLSAYLEKKYEVLKSEVFAEIKKINKRRKKLYDDEYIYYVCQKFGLTDDELLVEIKNKFKDYDNFRDYL